MTEATIEHVHHENYCLCGSAVVYVVVFSVALIQRRRARVLHTALADYSTRKVAHAHVWW